MVALFILPFCFALALFSLPRWLGQKTAFCLSLVPLILLLRGEIVTYNFAWLPQLSIHFHLAVDNLSLIFLYIVNVIIPVAILSRKIRDHANIFYGLTLLLQGLLIGFFTSQDLIFFTFFFEAILLPLYFMISRWGHEERIKASFKFIIYMIAGSSLMIAGALSLFFATATFDLATLAKEAEGLPYAPVIAAIFLLAFAVKTPLFPFHAWLADSYCQAPVPATILLSGILSKAGIYGLIRISFALFPTIMMVWSPTLLAFAIVGVLYGAFSAWGQTDYKRLIAYSSFSHVNFILVGLFIGNQMALNGAILQAINHAVTICGLFLVAGWLEMRLGTTSYGTTSGLAAAMPKLCWLTLFFVLSTVALPGLNNFISEVMVLYGLFQISLWKTMLVGSTVILSVLYMLRWFHSIYFNEPQPLQPYYADIKTKELLIATPLIALILWLGLYPAVALTLIESIK